MFKRLLSTALVFGLAALAPPAEAQAMQCLPRDSLVRTLQSNFGERLTGGGLQSPQRLLEVWSSGETGSFTVFFTQPDGMSCVVATGQHWNSVAPMAAEGVAG